MLVLGGGDGLAVREILKYPQVERITLVDLDPEMTRLFSTNPLLTRLNERSLLSPKVQVVNADAFLWVDSARPMSSTSSSSIFPTRRTTRSASCTPPCSSRALGHHLSERGAFVVQSTSPMFARKSFWCIEETIKQAGYRTFPYHAYVPSFGEWGFVLASRRRLHPADDLAGRTAIPGGRQPADALRVPVRHGARLDARQPSERSGAGAGRSKRNGAKSAARRSTDAPRVLPRRAAALVGLSIKGDRAASPADSSTTTSAARPRAPRAAPRSARRRDDGERMPVVIVGGGIAGLSAAWRLQKRGFDRFVAARDERAGGRQLALGRERDDARIRGARTTCRFPGKRATYVRELFAELGVLKPDGTWEERYCAWRRRSGCSSTGDGRRASSRRSALTAGDREQFRRLGDVTDCAARDRAVHGAARRRAVEPG